MSAHRLRARGALQRHQERFGPNMTPMIDIVLVILIFFMAGAAFLGQEWFIKSELLTRGTNATATDPLQLPPTRITLRIFLGADGTPLVGMGDGAYTLEQFAARISEFAKGTKTEEIAVLVEPEGPVTYEHVVRVHEACIAAGIERVGVVEPSPTPTSPLPPGATPAAPGPTATPGR